MAKEMTLSGCASSAQAAKLAKVEVICSYPIRPYTAIMMELAKMVANGELDAEFIHGEGEHAQLSVVFGAAAAGAIGLINSCGNVGGFLGPYVTGLTKDLTGSITNAYLFLAGVALAPSDRFDPPPA